MFKIDSSHLKKDSEEERLIENTNTDRRAKPLVAGVGTAFPPDRYTKAR
jgi:hypothetical protein